MRQQPDRCNEGGDVDALHQRFAQRVVRTTAGYRILSANLISFTPGFSQVNCAKLILETVYGFLFS